VKIAIFGGSGFIGTRLIARLLEKHEILIIDIKESRIFPRLWVWGDVCDPRSFEAHLKNVDCIVNLAAQHKDNVRPVTLYYDVNVEGARHICEAASRQGISRIVFTSSVAVYGASTDRSEENNDPQPNNHYGRSKWEAEKIYRQWYALPAGATS
jgi:nucleoside-diphosphate-sugar epimerase